MIPFDCFTLGMAIFDRSAFGVKNRNASTHVLYGQ